MKKKKIIEKMGQTLSLNFFRTFSQRILGAGPEGLKYYVQLVNHFQNFSLVTFLSTIEGQSFP